MEAWRIERDAKPLSNGSLASKCPAARASLVLRVLSYRCICILVGIELPFSVYKTGVLTVKRYPHMVRRLGIEPKFPAWQAGSLPLTYPRITLVLVDKRRI